MNEIVRNRNLSKFYGRERDLVDLNFAIGRGHVFDFLGPNGAGKTTTIRLLLDPHPPHARARHLFGAESGEGSGVRRAS